MVSRGFTLTGMPLDLGRIWREAREVLKSIFHKSSLVRVGNFPEPRLQDSNLAFKLITSAGRTPFRSGPTTTHGLEDVDIAPGMDRKVQAQERVD